MRLNKHTSPKRLTTFSAGVALCLAAVPAFGATLFVTSERDNTVTVLDSKTLAIKKVIPVGTRPRGIAITPDYKEIFVCVGDDDRLDVIDTKSLTVTRSVANVPDPELVAVDPVGKRVYAANEEESQLTVIDRGSGKIIGTVGVGAEPEGIAVSPDLSIVVNTSELTSMAHFINTKTLTIEDNVLVDQRPRDAEFTHDGKQVWVSAEVGGTVSVIDAQNRTIIRKINFDIPGIQPELIQPVGIVFSKDGKVAFVALSHANRIAVVDTSTLAPTTYILVGERPWHMALDPDGSKLYVANGNTNDLTVIDTASLKAIRSVNVGQLPWGVVTMP
jgi:PQQ-dependent catabolism-associated beta-propeller protein